MLTLGSTGINNYVLCMMYVLCPCTVPYPGTKYCMKYRATIEIEDVCVCMAFEEIYRMLHLKLGGKWKMSVLASDRQTDADMTH